MEIKETQLRQIIREEIQKLSESINFGEVINKIEDEYNWNYIEMEGNDVVRFDFKNGNDSMWIYQNGKINGNIPNDSNLKKTLKKLGLKKG